jgi:hypothetical protein
MYGRARGMDQARPKRRTRRSRRRGWYRAPQTGQSRAFVAATSPQWPHSRGDGVRSFGGGYEWKPAPGWYTVPASGFGSRGGFMCGRSYAYRTAASNELRAAQEPES